ncbi:hypothetical protein NE237_019878 [Protea cynaroides]|uniref:MYB-CC type transcription factor LHEQLE-containing domain-containing protein n=1 Tax=Protea cynaroides TaxID=273540 RepID=A0A9Q0H5K5_9MAGN|nr:hypothetical protein NE237_019878 [Protea cynaroides]
MRTASDLNFGDNRSTGNCVALVLLLLQFRGNGPGDTGLVLPTTDAKPRLNWTPELYECFIEAVNQLGGADTHGNSRAYHVPPKKPSSDNVIKFSSTSINTRSNLGTVQRHLQLRIEAQGKYLQSVLEKAQETLV